VEISLDVDLMDISLRGANFLPSASEDPAPRFVPDKIEGADFVIVQVEHAARKPLLALIN
jgi:hypothetical protein